eukprot:m.363229 g.363229  ORF g.363229 m.363229 type:complete len:376 (+) comp21735_c0_seq1:235-1362(+)
MASECRDVPTRDVWNRLCFLAERFIQEVEERKDATNGDKLMPSFEQWCLSVRRTRKVPTWLKQNVANAQNTASDDFGTYATTRIGAEGGHPMAVSSTSSTSTPYGFKQEPHPLYSSMATTQHPQFYTTQTSLHAMTPTGQPVTQFAMAGSPYPHMAYGNAMMYPSKAYTFNPSVTATNASTTTAVTPTTKVSPPSSTSSQTAEEQQKPGTQQHTSTSKDTSQSNSMPSASTSALSPSKGAVSQASGLSVPQAAGVLASMSTTMSYASNDELVEQLLNDREQLAQLAKEELHALIRKNNLSNDDQQRLWQQRRRVQNQRSQQKRRRRLRASSTSSSPPTKASSTPTTPTMPTTDESVNEADLDVARAILALGGSSP